MSNFNDQVKREICNRCEYFVSPTPNGKLCARTGEAIVSLITRQFSERPDVLQSGPDEDVTVNLGYGVTIDSTKQEIIDGLMVTEERLALIADRCTRARSVHFLSGNSDSFIPNAEYSRDELMLAVSTEI